MHTLVFVNPMKPGKLDQAKAFIAEITGPKKNEYIDLLQRYGLKNTKIHYHKIADAEFAVVTHEAEEDALERLANWGSSTHPFDIWFKEEGGKVNDFSLAGPSELLLDFSVK